MVSPKEPSNYERQLVALGRALQGLREEKTIEGAVKVVLTYLQQEFTYVLTWLALYDRIEHRLLGKGGSSATGETVFLKQRITLSPGDLMEQVVIQQRPLGIPDLRDEPRAGEWRKLAQQLNVQGTLILPIRHRDCCFGIVLLGSSLWGTSPHAEEKARLSMLLGGLAEVLYQFEMEDQRQQAKRPDEPLLNLLSRLRVLPSLKKRLEAVVDETHRFIGADRTNIYWYESQQRFFWRRLGNRDKATHQTVTSADQVLPVQELGSFYQTLSADQVVAIGETQSTLKSDIPGRLMQQIQARSLIAAPIVYQGELLGFLMVEGMQARMWQEEEKTYLRGAAQLLSLISPLEEMEESVQQVKRDQALTAEITHALYSEEDWRNTLRRCSEQLMQRLQAERVWVLLYNGDRQKFELCYQHQASHRRPTTIGLDNLNPVDWQMLERSTEAIGVENLQDDLKLMAWRQVLLELEVQSVLVCNTSIGKPIEGLVVIGHEAPRSWSRSDRHLLKVVSQQIGLLLHQFQLQTQVDQLQKNYQAVQWGLKTMQQMQQLERLENSSIQQVAQLLQVPLAALITWEPGGTTGKVAASLFAKPQFGLDFTQPISITHDALIQWALQNEGIEPLVVANLESRTRQWLTGTEIGQVLVYTLRTAPEHEPTAILLLGDRSDRIWSQHQLSALGILSNQLAWCRRYLAVTEVLLTQRSTLEQLNWYKHRRLEEIYRILGVGVRRLTELSHQKEAVSTMRYQQVLRHLSNTLTAATPLLKQEQWQFQTEPESIPLASLLKRSLERLDTLIKQRQLWSQVHNGASLSVGGDIAKIEYIVHEMLMLACWRSPLGGRLDIWCRPMDEHWLEMSITDNGAIDPHLLEQFELGRAGDPLAPSLLDQPPGLHLVICQAMVRRMGGEITLDYLEDGRLLTRLILPVATGSAPRSEHEISGFF
ncbi:MAG: GAF domain-containing protein [Elainella sp. Prado103]|nr:GAF domain-containing protein [Elainella sp. Prado103]